MGGKGGEIPPQQSWPTVLHRLNEPGLLPPDALWPRLRDAGKAIISHFSPSLSVCSGLPTWKPASPLQQHRRQTAGWMLFIREYTRPLNSRPFATGTGELVKIWEKKILCKHITAVLLDSWCTYGQTHPCRKSWRRWHILSLQAPKWYLSFNTNSKMLFLFCF